MVFMIIKFGKRRLTRGMGARGMRCCVNARATWPRTQNKEEKKLLSPRIAGTQRIAITHSYPRITRILE
jgi:hypothetical protein